MKSLFKRSPRASSDVEQAGEPPALPVDPLSGDFIADPYPTLSWLRLHQPVHRCATGAWMLTRYDDIEQALADRRFGNAPASHSVLNQKNRRHHVSADIACNILPFQDAPEHTLPRKAITRVFHEFLQSSDVDMPAMAEALLAPYKEAREFDILEDFATPFSVGVMQRLFGFSDDDTALLREGSHWLFFLFAPMQSLETVRQVDEGLAVFRAFFLSRIADRREQPGSDLISALLKDPQTSGLGDEVLADNCMLLFADGIENVDAAIANAVVLLARDPAQWRRLRKKPALLKAAVEECLRLEPPAQFVARVASESLALHGQQINQGDAVLLMLASANRDETKFENACQLDVRRSPGGQIGFGRGRHSCIGARLAKAKIHAALRTLLHNCPALALTRAPLVWQQRPGHRWLKQLVVVW